LGIKAFNIILGISKLIKVTWAAAMGVATVAQKGLNLAMKANPIGIIITLVAALVAALVFFFTQTEIGQKIFAGFMDFLSNAMSATVNFFRNAWETITSVFRTAIDGVLGFFRALPQNILRLLTGATTWILSVGRDIITGLWNGLKAVWTTVSSWFRDIPNMIRNILSGATNWLSGIGRQVIDGFLNGMKNAWRAVTSWISGAASRVSGAFKSILGIRSPSRVFMEHGMDIGRGLQIGLEKMQPKVMAEVGGLVNVTGLSSQGLGVGQSLAPSTGVGGGGVVYNINVTGGMMDPEGVAREVVRVLNNSQRRSGAGAGRLVA
jgi:phage-related protein